MKIDKDIIDSIVSKTMDGRVHKKGVSFLMSFEDLYKILDTKETNYVKELISQKPSDFGNKEKFRGIDPVPRYMVAIADQVVNYGGKKHIVETQYLPKHVYAAYSRLRKDYKLQTRNEQRYIYRLRL
jgi:hypothetical protein